MRRASQIQISSGRIIDANINRTKEGLRVCEEITRFILNSRSLTAQFKNIRHKIDSLLKYLLTKASLLKKRQILTDVGRGNFADEMQRRNYQDIFFANIQRVQESLRVLEEFTKLTDIEIAASFKRIRYDIYEIEKKVIKRFAALSNHR